MRDPKFIHISHARTGKYELLVIAQKLDCIHCYIGRYDCIRRNKIR